MAWFSLAILATLLFGIQSFVYQKVSFRGANKYLVTFIFLFTVFILAVILNIFRGFVVINLGKTLIFALLFAIFFYIVTILQMKALEYLPSNRVFPITSTAVFLTVIYSVLVFKESLDLLKILGIFLIFLSIILIKISISNSKKMVHGKRGFILAMLVILPASGMAIVNKYAAIQTDLFSFVLFNYLFSSIFALGAYFIKKKSIEINLKKSVLFGIALGLINFVAYFAFLFSMRTGPLSIISSIQSMFVLVTVLLANLFHEEELTLKQLFFVLLSILGIIFLKI